MRSILWRGAHVAVICLLLASCQRVGLPAPVTPVAARACPAPGIDTRDWMVVNDSVGVTYRLPDGFDERQNDDLPYREWRLSGDRSGDVRIGFSPSREYFVTLRRVPAPVMLDMTECMDTVNGRQVLVQAWRTEGGSFRGGRRYDLFEILALVPIEPTLTLFVTGGASEPQIQEILLTIARSVEVAPGG